MPSGLADDRQLDSFVSSTFNDLTRSQIHQMALILQCDDLGGAEIRKQLHRCGTDAGVGSCDDDAFSLIAEGILHGDLLVLEGFERREVS